MQIAFYKSSKQLAVFLNDREARRLDPSGAGAFRAEVTPTARSDTFKVNIIPDDAGNPVRQLNTGWHTVAWTHKSTRQSGVSLLRPRNQAAPNVGSEAWGPDGSLCCEISYREAEAGLPALLSAPNGNLPVTVTSTDDLGAVLAQMKAHGLKGRVTTITVDVI